MSTRLHSLTICSQGSVISILQLPASASGYARTPRLDLIPRVDMVVSKKKKEKKVSTLLPEEKCACTNCQRLFSSRCVQPNLGFSLVQVNLALNLFENRITRTPSSSETEVSLYSFGVQNKLISFSLFLMIRFSNKSVFEQPSRANCVRQPRFDTCQQIITSKKHLDIFYSNLKKYLTSRLYNLTSRLLQKHLDLDENNLKWQLWTKLNWT